MESAYERRLRDEAYRLLADAKSALGLDSLELAAEKAASATESLSKLRDNRKGRG